MKYKINERVKSNTFNKEQEALMYYLYNAGIDNPQEYLEFNIEYDGELLYNMHNALILFDEHVNKESNMAILVDSDVDGLTSSSIIYSYINENFNMSSNQLKYIVRTGKKHGLDENVCQFIQDNDIQLLIVPDAQVDYQLAKKVLYELPLEKPCDILVLDHHDTQYIVEDCDKERFVIVNPNYILDKTYPNKELSGCAVTYKFIQALDNLYFTNHSSKIQDLVALSLIGDSMSFKSKENKYLVQNGIKKINSELLEAFIKTHAFSLNGRNLNPIDYSFKIVPMINAMVRIGTYEEIETVFKAMCGIYEEYPYKKRGSTEITQEDCYTRSARLCTNIRSRQSKIRDKDMKFIENIIKEKQLYNNKIIVVDTGDNLNSDLSGLSANKLSDKYQRPIIVLKPYKDDILGGSARNCNNGFIDNLKQYCQDSGLFKMAEGHNSSFGINIYKDNIDKLVDKFNNDFKDVDITKYYNVTDVCTYSELVNNMHLFDDIEELDKYAVNDIQTPNFLIKDIIIDDVSKVTTNNNQTMWQYKRQDDEICMIKFNCKDDDKIIQMINNMDSSMLNIDVIGRLTYNTYEGITTPQIIIEDYDITLCSDTIDDINWEENKKSDDDWDW